MAELNKDDVTARFLVEAPLYQKWALEGVKTFGVPMSEQVLAPIPKYIKRVCFRCNDAPLNWVTETTSIPVGSVSEGRHQCVDLSNNR